MSFKDELLQHLDSLRVNPQAVAEGMAQVVRGETIKEKFDAGGNLMSREILKKPDDVMRGAMIYDALRGGDLGIAPRQLAGTKGAQAGNVVHKRLSVDNRIIANADAAEEEITLGDVFGGDDI